ncbi:MAG: barstar [Ruminococcaceae bacterium]|nr:barstar [Oscillospiraceae bacterium]
MKKTLVIDGRRCKTKEKTHEYLAKKKGFPPYYGKNLDALADVLSTYDKNTLIKVKYSSSILKNLGEYGEIMLNIFRTTAEKGLIQLEIK